MAGNRYQRLPTEPDDINNIILWDMSILVVLEDNTSLPFDLCTFKFYGRRLTNEQNDTSALREYLRFDSSDFELWWELLGREFILLYWLRLADGGQTLSLSAYWNMTAPGGTGQAFVEEGFYRNYFAYVESSQTADRLLPSLYTSFLILWSQSTMFDQCYTSP